MITLVRTATVIPGKHAAVRDWAAEVGAIVSRVSGRQVHVGAPVGGNVSGICFIAQFDSLGQMEEALAKVMSNSEFLATLIRVEGMLVPASVTDQIFRTN
jgi:hypothetical protein